MTGRLGLAALWVLLTLLAAAPLWLTLPKPASGLAVTQAVHMENGHWRPVTLPQAGGPERWEHYRLQIDADGDGPRYLYLPTVSQRAVIALNGQQIADTANRSTMMGLASGMAALVALPSGLLHPGSNALDLRVQSISLAPTYLSPLYVGHAGELTSYYRMRVFLLEYLRVMVPACQLLITLVVLVLWLYRPCEAQFGWLTLLLFTSMYIYLDMLQDVFPALARWLPYVHMAGASASMALVITALLIAGLQPPRWLKLATVAVPAACLLASLSGIVSAPRLVVFVNAPLSMLGLLASLAIAGWAVLVRRAGEARLLLLPLLLAVMAALHDYAVIRGWLDDPILLSVYYRPLLMIGIAMILMRRLGLSLNRLDDVNAYLTQRLQEQEKELERLHREERREAALQALVDERRRLTADLHDGLSGHLASIIALSEREQSMQVERAAREALEDLRMVIHSLDIQDRELPVALAGLRERLERQLRRAGIRLEWSMAHLPEIAGVTPSHALNVLRILQEAVTNAIRHGHASRIVVRGSEDRGQVQITVENDGLPFPATPNPNGNGLPNMRRRIRRLGGDIEITSQAEGTMLRMLLPRELPAAT